MPASNGLPGRCNGIMTLTKEQQAVVEANLGLVGKVIKDKVHGLGSTGIFSYEDLYQIGSIGLCKAAATDQGGCFSTYAYRIIWNTICDALIYATRRQTTELLTEDGTVYDSAEAEETVSDLQFDLEAAMEKARRNAPPSIQMGMDALALMADGYTSAEISEQLGSAPNKIRALASKARKYLQSCPEIRALQYGEAAL